MRLPANGIALWARVTHARPDAVPLLLLHGFTGSADTWNGFTPSPPQSRPMLAVDLIGHARSDAPDDAARYSIQQCVEDLLVILENLEMPRVDVLGYSMGGRVALHLAIAAPQRVRALILESGSPGIADADERRARAAADDALADAIERDGVPAFVDRWERTPLLELAETVSQAARERQRRERLAHTARGLANSLRGMGAGRQTPLWTELKHLNRPTLLIVGARDERYRKIAEAMAQQLPDARVTVVEGAGHVVHIDRPRPFESHVAAFLEQLDPGYQAGRA